MEKIMIWCDLNIEQELLAKTFGDLCVSIHGSTPDDDRVELEEKWRLGDVPILISKASVFGFGMNWQHCNHCIFVGMSDSFESVFQATKRFHRHGQTREVNRHLIISEAEGSVLNNVKRKEKEFTTMIENMVQHTRKMSIANIRSLTNQKDSYLADTPIILPHWVKEGGY